MNIQKILSRSTGNVGTIAVPPGLSLPTPRGGAIRKAIPWDRDPQLRAALTMDSVRLMPSNERLDALETGLFLRSLTQISTELYNELFPELKARTLLPVSHEIAAGADFHALQGYTFEGRPEVITDFSKDLPTVQIHAGERIVSVKSFGASYAYSVQEMRAQQFASRPLDAIRATMAREAMEQYLEEIAAIGIANANIVGAMNDGNVPIIAPGSGLPYGSWDTLGYSADGVNSGKILSDLKAIENYSFTTQKAIFTPDTMVFDTVSYAQVNSQQMSQYDKRTILQAFMEQATFIKSVDWWLYCNTTGVTGGARVWAYNKNPRMVQLQIAQEFEQFPPIARMLAWVIPCHMRVAGVEYHRPLAAVYVDGVHS